MSRGSKLTEEERIAAVQEYLEGRGSYEAIAKKYGIALQTLRQKVIYAKTNGIESIRISHTNKQYSAETKLKAVTEYLNGKGSQVEICRRYHISDTKVFRRWISCYNSGKDFKERTRSERGITMNKGRKTTQEERAQIVAFCIENGKDYGLTMEKYGVSYQQIYSWVRKYEATKTGFISEKALYICESCEGCPYKQNCTKAKGNKTLGISHKFKELRTESLENITTEFGRQLRMNRSIQAEGVFGVLKHDHGFRRFLCRGKNNIRTEFLLLGLAYNIKKLFAKISENRLGISLFELKTA